MADAWNFTVREMHPEDQAAAAVGSGCPGCAEPVTHVTGWNTPASMFEPVESAACGAHAAVFADEHGVEIQAATAAPQAVEEQAAKNLRAFLSEAIDRYAAYVSVRMAHIIRRPDSDDGTTRLAFEIESRPGNRFVVVMPTLPLDVLRAGVPSFKLPPAQRRAHEILVRHQSGTTTDYWRKAMIRCGHVADYRTPGQALSLLFSRM